MGGIKTHSTDDSGVGRLSTESPSEARRGARTAWLFWLDGSGRRVRGASGLELEERYRIV